MSYRVRLAPAAGDDLRRLYDFQLQRSAALAIRAEEAIQKSFLMLRDFPFACRKAGHDPLIREMLIPFGSSGYVALFEIEDHQTVTIIAVRHQRESDYH